jgi:hypothetical protein
MSDLMTKDTKTDWRGGPRTSRRGPRETGRTDYNALAAVEYRRALRAVLAARGETRLRVF